MLTSQKIEERRDDLLVRVFLEEVTGVREPQHLGAREILPKAIERGGRQDRVLVRPGDAHRARSERREALVDAVLKVGHRAPGPGGELAREHQDGCPRGVGRMRREVGSAAGGSHSVVVELAQRGRER